MKAGLSAGGKQRYLCRGCNKRSSQDLNPRGLSAEKEAQVLAALNERMSLRAAARTFGISRNTISALLQKKDALILDEQRRTGQAYLERTLLPAHKDDVLELDEVWSFVLKKKNRVWIWFALCRRTRQIVAWWYGPRTKFAGRQLWNKIPADYKKGTCFTDFFAAYGQVLPQEQHRCSIAPVPSKKERPILLNASILPCDQVWRVW